MEFVGHSPSAGLSCMTVPEVVSRVFPGMGSPSLAAAPGRMLLFLQPQYQAALDKDLGDCRCDGQHTCNPLDKSWQTPFWEWVAMLIMKIFGLD